MKEALNLKSGATEASLAGGATLDVFVTLMGLRTTDVRGLTTCPLTAQRNCESLLVPWYEHSLRDSE